MQLPDLLKDRAVTQEMLNSARAIVDSRPKAGASVRRDGVHKSPAENRGSVTRSTPGDGRCCSDGAQAAQSLVR